MDRYLVAGAAGMIGSRVAAILTHTGNRVVGLDNLNDAYDVRLKRHRLDGLDRSPLFKFVEGDASDELALRSIGGDFAAVINLAARAGVRQSVDTPGAYVQDNIMATLRLLEYCRHRSIPKFILASSSSLYGVDSQLPFLEDQNTDYPISPYAATKKAAEVLSYTYHALHEIDVTVFRYFTVYGPAGRPDMAVFRFVQRIREGRPITVFGDGSQSRDFTFVEDIATGTIAGLTPVGYEVINLGGNQPRSVSDLILVIETELGLKAKVERKPRHEADVPITWANINKAQEVLGWSPRTSLEDGISRTVGWYEDERAWAAEVETEAVLA